MGGYVLGWLFHHKMPPPITHTSTDQMKIPSQVACRKLRPRYNTVHKKPPQSILPSTDQKKISPQVARRMSRVAKPKT